MKQYYSTCPAGLEGIVKDLLRERLGGCRIKRLLSGALLYEADAPAGEMDCLQNTYEVIALRPRCARFQEALRWAASDGRLARFADQAMRRWGFKRFRVMFSEANRLSQADPRARAALEKGITAARVDRVNPDTELLLLWRSEGLALLLLRLTRRVNNRQTLKRGELSPAVAQCMVFLAHPRPDHVFLDPFSGHGALGAARAQSGFREMALLDIDGEMVKETREKLQRVRRSGRGRLTVQRGDALNLASILPAESVDEIVTDPPWGLYEPLPLPPEAFYPAMLKSFCGVLRPGGYLVLLSADKAHFERALRAESGLRWVEKKDILVNGKKAAVYLAQREGT